MRNLALITAAAISLMLGAPLNAQVSDNVPADQSQTPGLQQAPDGQTMKTASERDKSVKESQAAPTGTESTNTSTSTGPTFPNDRLAK